MTEATLKSGLVKELRLIPGAVVLRHEDKITSGIPDISFTLNGKTSWWEGKFANPRFKSKGIQELTMKKLASAGCAFYIVWDNFLKRTFIVHPSQLGMYALDYRVEIESFTPFNPFAAANAIKVIHDNAIRP